MRSSINPPKDVCFYLTIWSELCSCIFRVKLLKRFHKIQRYLPQYVLKSIMKRNRCIVVLIKRAKCLKVQRLKVQTNQILRRNFNWIIIWIIIYLRLIIRLVGKTGLWKSNNAIIADFLNLFIFTFFISPDS